MHRNIAVSLIGLFAIGLTMQAAGNNAEEEAAIRKQIAAVEATGNRSHSLPDSIFWSGAYKKPVIGIREDKTTQRDGEGSIADRNAATQKLVTTPQRIIVSNSKDLAYEYSTFTIEFDTKAGKHVKFDGAGLRVWQKQGGEWKQAAIFARPFDE
jgi:hypothetical protein